LSLAILTLIIPSVVFGVLAGVYVDRWDKRTVLIATNVIRGCIAFGYAGFDLAGSLPLSLLLVINFLFSTVGQFFAPAETAMIPTVVPRQRLLQANSLFHLTFTASPLVGLVLLGLVVATVVRGFADRLLHVRAEDAVFVMAPAGVGMVAGTALLNRWGDRFEKHLLTNVGLFMVAACLALSGGLAFVKAVLTGG